MASILANLIRRALRLRRTGFARDQRGATAVEFALLALPFFSIVGAILETSVVFLSSQVLESAVEDTGRLIRTGQARGVIMSSDDFKSRVCDRVYGLFGDCSGLHVEVQTIEEFDEVSISAPIDWSCQVDCLWTRPETYTSGDTSKIVVIQVYYKWPIILSLGDMTLANLPGQKRLLGSSAVFRNEPYS